MQKLSKKLSAVAPKARFDDAYFSFRGEIGQVWEVDQRSDTSSIDSKILGGYQRKKRYHHQ